MKGSFLKAIQVANVGQTAFLPEVPGVYILLGGTRVYCGCAWRDLRTRTIQSITEQKFGKDILLFPDTFLSQPDQFSDRKTLENFEAQCISSLFTIIWGNGLPVSLTNHRHAVPLPEEAWSAEEASATGLAIKIAQSTLYLMGFPMHMVGLPYYGFLFSTMRWKLMASVKEDLTNILEKERISRCNPDNPRIPLRPMSVI